MKDKIILLFSLLIIITTVFWLSRSNINNKTENSDKIQITTSFYPYYFFASEIGGNKTKVVNITPAGTEPHDYEPTSQDIANIYASKMLIINGSAEPWSAKIKDTLKNKNTLVLETGNGLVSNNDPHIWLSLKLAKIQVNLILNKLIQIDPENTVLYQDNTNKLLSSLESLDNTFKTTLSSCNSRNIVTSHAAFAYLSLDYGLNQVSIAGVSPDSEPSLKDLANIANYVKANKIKYIFFESLVSPKLSQTIANETGAKTLVLNPIEGLTPEDIAQGKNYLIIMQENLKNLKIALGCIN